MIPDDKDNEEMSEEERAAAAEWEAMAGGDEASAEGEAEQQAGGGGPKSNRVLDQDEIDSLLGLGAGGGGEDDKPSGIQAIGGLSVFGDRCQWVSQVCIWPICHCWLTAMS